MTTQLKRRAGNRALVDSQELDGFVGVVTSVHPACTSITAVVRPQWAIREESVSTYRGSWRAGSA